MAWAWSRFGKRVGEVALRRGNWQNCHLHSRMRMQGFSNLKTVTEVKTVTVSQVKPQNPAARRRFPSLWTEKGESQMAASWASIATFPSLLMGAVGASYVADRL